jgi:hypothetical protein
MLALLILNGALLAAMYVLDKQAVLGGVTPLALLYWQAVSSAIVVSAIAGLRGERPRFSLRYRRHYAIAALLGMTLPFLATGLAARGILPGVLMAVLAPLSLVAGSRYRVHDWPAGLSPLSAASGMLIAQALVLDPIVAYAHAIVLPSTALTPLDWVLLVTTALSSAFYVSALTLAAPMPNRRTLRWTT